MLLVFSIVMAMPHISSVKLMKPNNLKLGEDNENTTSCNDRGAGITVMGVAAHAEASSPYTTGLNIFSKSFWISFRRNMTKEVDGYLRFQ